LKHRPDIFRGKRGREKEKKKKEVERRVPLFLWASGEEEGKGGGGGMEARNCATSLRLFHVRRGGRGEREEEVP